MLEIEKHVNEIITKYCSDYPNINRASVHEKLYAIDQTIDGVNQANNDCHKLIGILCNKLNLDVATAWSLINLKPKLDNVNIIDRLKSIDRYDVGEFNEGGGYNYSYSEKNESGSWILSSDIDGLIKELTDA